MISTSTSISSSATGSSIQPSSTNYNTYQMVFASGTGPSNDGSGMLATAGGDATAVGQDTLSAVSSVVQVSSGPASTEALASTDLTAAAYSQNGTAYAGTSAYTDIYGSADHTFWSSFSEASSTSTNTAATAISTSVVQAYALDLTSFSSASSPTTQDTPSSAPSPDLHLSGLEAGYSGIDHDFGDLDVVFDGNVALADVEVVAFGPDTLAEVDLFVLALEDQFSTVTFTALGAVA